MARFVYRGNKDYNDPTTAIKVSGVTVQVGQSFDATDDKVERLRSRYSIDEESSSTKSEEAKSSKAEEAPVDAKKRDDGGQTVENIKGQEAAQSGRRQKFGRSSLSE